MNRVFLFLFFTAAAAAQTTLSDHNLNAWAMYFGDHQLGQSKWGVHLEGQWRRADAGLSWQQLLLRPGVNYQATPRLLLTAGYAFIDTHRYGDYPVPVKFPEHRFFQQAVWTQRAGRLDLQSRFRLEQRELGQSGNAARPWRHENRFRYMLRANVPLGQSKYYVGLYNELFVNWGRNVVGNHFDQNRAYVALGRTLARQTRIEIGFLEQTLQRRGGLIWEHNHTLQLAVFSRLPFRRK